LDEINEIKEINHEKASTILSIEFKNGNKLIITKPDIIIGGKTYLKIVKADKIEWQWDTVLEDYKYSIYRREGKKIKKDSNAKWFSLKTFISIGEPALMIAYKYNFSKPQDVILESFIVKK